MRLNIVTKREAPIAPYPTCQVCVGVSLIPYILGSLWLRSQKYWWNDEGDSQRLGRQLLAEQGAYMLGGCNNVELAIDRLYRLTDSIHNGTVYTVSGEGTVEEPYVYSPDIPLVPAITTPLVPSIRATLEHSERLVDNLVNGTVYADASDPRNFRQQLEDLIAASEGAGLDDEILEQLIAIVAALG